MISSIVHISPSAFAASADFAGKTIAQDDFAKKIDAQLQKQSFDEAFDALAAVSDQIIEKASQKDTETFFIILTQLLAKLDNNKRNERTSKFAASISASSVKPVIRLSILKTLLNSQPQAKAFDILLSYLNYAQKNKLYEHVKVVISSFENIAIDCSMSVDQKQQLYLVIAEILVSAGKSDESLSVLLRALRSVGDAKAEKSLDLAARTISQAVKCTTFFNFEDLFDIAAVQNLNGHKSHGNLFTLLSLLLRGSVDEYTKFADSNKDTYTANGLDAAKVLEKARLLNLCQLLVEGTEVSFDAIATGLKVDKSDVEKLVIRAVGLKLVRVRIDQVKRSVFVSKTTPRVFSEWKQMSEQVGGWKDNLNGVLSKMQKANK